MTNVAYLGGDSGANITSTNMSIHNSRMDSACSPSTPNFDLSLLENNMQFAGSDSSFSEESPNYDAAEFGQIFNTGDDGFEGPGDPTTISVMSSPSPLSEESTKASKMHCSTASAKYPTKRACLESPGGSGQSRAPRTTPPLRPVVHTASGQAYRKRVSEMTAPEVERIRESNRVMARRNRAKKKASRDDLKQRLDSITQSNSQLRQAVVIYRERIAQLTALATQHLIVGDVHGTAIQRILGPPPACASGLDTPNTGLFGSYQNLFSDF